MTSPNRWLILGLLFLARTAMGVQFQTIGSVGPILIDALNIEYTAVGLLIGLYLLPGVFIALPAGVLGERFGAKRVVVAGLSLMIAGGLMTALGAWFPVMACGRLVSGTGAVLMNVMLTKMVADWFAGRELGTAMALLVTSWPGGIAIGLLGFAPLAGLFGWQAVMIAAALIAAPAMVAIAWCYREPASAPPVRTGFSLSLSKREWLLVSCAGFVWATYNVGYILLVSFLPGHFAAGGYGLSGANALVSWLGWGMIVFVPIGGLLSDRLRRPHAVMAAGFILSGLAAAALAAGLAPVIPAFIVIAVAIGLPAGPIMTLPASALTPPHRATGMGVYFTWYYALMAVMPALAGLARDMSGNAATPVLAAALMLALALAGIAAFAAAARVRA